MWKYMRINLYILHTHTQVTHICTPMNVYTRGSCIHSGIISGRWIIRLLRREQCRIRGLGRVFSYLYCFNYQWESITCVIKNITMSCDEECGWNKRKGKLHQDVVFCFFLFKSVVLWGYIRDGDLEVEPVKALVCVLLHSGCAGGYGCLGALQSLW